MSNSRGERPPGFQQFGMSGDRVDARLHENPVFSEAPRHAGLGERAAARRMMPEQIVGDEDLISGCLEVIGRRSRSIARVRPIEELPDRAERAAERAAARGLDQVRRAVMKACVPLRHPATRCRAGSGVSSRSKSVSGFSVSCHVDPVPDKPARDSPGVSGGECLDERWDPALAVVQANRVDVGVKKGRRIGSGRWPPTDQSCVGPSRRTRSATARTSSISNACMHAMPTSGGRNRRENMFHRFGENLRSRSVTRCPRASSAAPMSSMPERLDAEERTRARIVRCSAPVAARECSSR